ncbi:hypothetical protein [Nocardioides bigeumensis]|jgi:ATP synthase protein I
MTTTTKQEPRLSGMRPLVVTMVAVDLAVLAVAGLAALLADGDAAVAALVGGLVTSVVIFTGTAMVNLVAGLVPSLSLLVALMTYTLQLVVMVAVFLALSRSSLGADATSRGWLGAAVITAAVTWLVGHLVTATRARIPIYDLPAQPPAQPPVQPGKGGGE